jgi:hypothetical protein
MERETSINLQATNKTNREKMPAIEEGTKIESLKDLLRKKRIESLIEKGKGTCFENAAIYHQEYSDETVWYTVERTASGYTLQVQSDANKKQDAQDFTFHLDKNGKIVKIEANPKIEKLSERVNPDAMADSILLLVEGLKVEKPCQ